MNNLTKIFIAGISMEDCHCCKKLNRFDKFRFTNEPMPCTSQGMN